MIDQTDAAPDYMPHGHGASDPYCAQCGWPGPMHDYEGLVRHADVAAALASRDAYRLAAWERQNRIDALETENAKLKATNKRLNRRAQSAEAAADAKADDFNKRAAGSQIRNHYFVRARDAEAERDHLLSAIRAWVEARDAKPPRGLDDAENAVWEREVELREDEAEAQLRTLAGQAGE